MRLRRHTIGKNVAADGARVATQRQCFRPADERLSRIALRIDLVFQKCAEMLHKRKRVRD